MKTIIVVGVGALGSHVVQALRNVEATLRVIDFDRVEQRNVASQFHGKPHVGKAKVASLQQTMNFLFGRKIEVVPHKLVQDNVKELLGKADLVIDCLDNAVARLDIQMFIRNFAERGYSKSIPCLHGALDANGSFGRVVWDENFTIDSETGLGTATCEDGAHLPFIAVTASYLAYAAQRFLRDGRQIGFEISPGGAIRT
jgi:molybdopterin/thiamine biosynthesis adenylyltransferase